MLEPQAVCASVSLDSQTRAAPSPPPDMSIKCAACYSCVSLGNLNSGLPLCCCPMVNSDFHNRTPDFFMDSMLNKLVNNILRSHYTYPQKIEI